MKQKELTKTFGVFVAGNYLFQPGSAARLKFQILIHVHTEQLIIFLARIFFFSKISPPSGDEWCPPKGSAIPANATHLVWPMLVHRLRRWPNIGQTLARCVVFAGMLAFHTSSECLPLPVTQYHWPQIKVISGAGHNFPASARWCRHFRYAVPYTPCANISYFSRYSPVIGGASLAGVGH